MSVIIGVLVFVFVLVAVLLAVLVLIQDEQGDSIGGIFGGSSTSAFGASSSSVLGKITRFFGAAFIILSLVVALFLRSPDKEGVMGQALLMEQENNWWEQEADLPDTSMGSDLVLPE